MKLLCLILKKKLRTSVSQKAGQESDMPTKIIKDNIGIFPPFCIKNLISWLKQGSYHLKSTDVTPVLKTEDRKKKDNYRPTSIIPNFSKVFEWCKLCLYFESILPKC